MKTSLTTFEAVPPSVLADICNHLDDNVDIVSDPGGREYVCGLAPVPTTGVLRNATLPAVIPVRPEALSLADITDSRDLPMVYTILPEHGSPSTFYLKLSKYAVDGEVFAHVDRN